MLTLLCTAPSSSLSSPIEGTAASTRAPPPPSSGASSSAAEAPPATAGPSTNSFSLSSRKLSIRRPSIRKRIQTLSRVSSATLSNAAGSSFSFFRHASGSRSPSSSSSAPASAGNAGNAGTSTSGSGSTHTRGASTSSFASGKSTKSSKSNKSSNSSTGRLNALHIGAPSAFKHQFHLGPNMTSDGPWDETRWRQIVEMRGNDQDDTPVIDVVPPTGSSAEEPPRVSTSSEKNVSHSRSASQPASASSPNLLSIATGAPSASSSPTPTSATEGSSNEAAAADKAKRQAKRASLVKRKPVPQLNPEDIEPVPNTPAPTQTTFVLMPDLTANSGQSQLETAPAERTSFEVSKEEAQKEALEKLVRAATVKERPTREKENSTDVATQTRKQVTIVDAPEHIFIRHPSPPPKPPPRRHTLAHMQARTLGRGMSDGPSLPSGPAVPRKEETQTQTQERKRSRARPVPIVSPSPTSSPGVAQDVVDPAVPPGLSIPTEDEKVKVEDKDRANESHEKKPDETRALPPVPVGADNSPRPSLSSLASTSESTETSRSTSTSSTSTYDLDLEMGPRTPTDDRRISAGSTSSTKCLKGGRGSPRNVRIVVPGQLDFEEDAEVVDGDDGEDGENVATPRAIRRASKRPNPPVRRIEANEESVYVTADEADDL